MSFDWEQAYAWRWAHHWGQAYSDSAIADALRGEGIPFETFNEWNDLYDRVSEGLLRELQEYGIVQPDRRDGRSVYDETDLEIVRAAAELSRFGVAGRNLRVFVSSADREAALLQQLVGPALRSRSQARRKEAIENLESLAAVCGHLKHLLLVRDLRRLKGD